MTISNFKVKITGRKKKAINSSPSGLPKLYALEMYGTDFHVNMFRIELKESIVIPHYTLTKIY